MSEYTDNQVESVLRDIGIEVITDTDTNVLALCPYHRNTDSPAFSIDKVSGAWKCFAPHCDERGNLVKLVQNTKHCNIFVAKRLIERHRGAEPELGQYIDDLFQRKDELPSFPQDVINRMADDLWNSPGQVYMNGRGFDDKTLAYFGVGYSAKKDMVAIPMHDWEGNPVGVVGRGIKDKVFKNSRKLPTRKCMFNTHRAKKCGDKVVIVESSMDAMRIHQAGYPYVVATNGSIFSDAHVQTIARYWNEIIIMTDFDDFNDHRNVKCNKCENTCEGHNPGRVLGEKMVKGLQGKRILWAAYDYGIVYPHGAKDAGDLTIQEIQQCIDRAVSDVEYTFWKTEFPLLNKL